MKSCIGKNITFSLYGESHGESMGIIIDGLPSGLEINLDFIHSQLELRKPKGKISTQRQERDEVKITSGYFNGKTTGMPLHLQIENHNTKSRDYHPELPRPSHADYAAHMKYEGYQDYRGGGHFSGRLTSLLVAAGAIAIDLLRKKDILIGTHILKCQQIEDRPFMNYKEDILKCNASEFAMLEDDKAVELKDFIEQAAMNKDSVGAVLETCIYQLPSGIGEPFFHSLESELSRYLFSIPAVKGVEFGLGFDFAMHYGSEVNDEWQVEDGKVFSTSNHNGGINGGISNGMPITFKVVIKPTPSIYKKQHTINLNTMENTTLEIVGRHDPAIFHRARVVIDSVVAMALLDMICEAHQGDWMK